MFSKLNVDGSPAEHPLLRVLATRRPKLQNHEVIRGQDTHYINVPNLNQYNFWGHRWKNNSLKIFGCKVGQSIPNAMTFDIDASRWQLDVFTKFEKNISEHVEKSLENYLLAACAYALLSPTFEYLWHPKGHELSNHDAKKRVKAIHYICEGSIIFEAMIAEKGIWLIFSYKVSQSLPITMKLELGVSRHRLEVYISSF